MELLVGSVESPEAPFSQEMKPTGGEILPLFAAGKPI
jgi:hypothetical protein